MNDRGKVCTHCKQFKPIAEYAKKLDGLNAHCRACQSIKNKAYRKKHAERLNEQNKAWREANAERQKESQKRYRQKNIEHRRAKCRDWYAAHKNDPERKKRLAEYEKAWRATHREHINARKRADFVTNHARRVANAEAQSRRRACMPKWVDKQQLLVIYERAAFLTKATGVAYHVDHIVPITNAQVCGLHVPWNLRVITAKENHEKKNAFIEEIAIAL